MKNNLRAKIEDILDEHIDYGGDGEVSYCQYDKAVDELLKLFEKLRK